MLLILPDLSCYSFFPTYHATHSSRLITLLIIPDLSRYSFFPTYHATHSPRLITLLILLNLSCHSSFPIYHATHLSLFIMLLILPNYSCYSSLPIYHATYLSQFIMLLLFPHLSCYLSFQPIMLLVLSHLSIHSSSHSTWYKWCRAENDPKLIKKQRFSQPTNRQTRPRRHVSAQIKPPIAGNKLSIWNRKVQDNELSISTPFLQHESDECTKSRTAAATCRDMDRTGW